ncbi:spermatogenesis-associated serine-rich protein 1 [Mixophyes fleayi]|uniref:spermatogenesis-associated serine-rich protein 1 n=1 Tax=Mixophyes fleayi TaxID=3061075 RepID=UPI003F4DAEA0
MQLTVPGICAEVWRRDRMSSTAHQPLKNMFVEEMTSEVRDPLSHTDDIEDCYALLHRGGNYNQFEEVNGKGVYLPLIHYKVPTYPNCDLDWKPCVRCLPSPRYSDAPLPHIKDIKFLDGLQLQRSFPRSHLDVGAEWSFYPNFGFPFTYHIGKRCIIDGIHRKSQSSTPVRTLPLGLMRKKKVSDPRNGIPTAQLGDKPFRTVEYSPGFHKFGSTLPVVNFRESYKIKADTFIPLQKLPMEPCAPFRVKIRRQHLEEEKRDVKELNTWKPAQRSFLFDLPGIGRIKPEHDTAAKL